MNISLKTNFENTHKELEEAKEFVEKINTLVSYVEDPSCWKLKCPREKLVAFIESLPKRFSPQAKQEWDEEDEIRLESCILYLANARDCIEFNQHIGDNAKKSGCQEIQKNIEWLKSLSPSRKPRWEINNTYKTKWTKEMIDEKFEELVEQEHKTAEWGEEDIKKICLEEYTKGFNDATFVGKLKEWRVEDEDRIRQIERIAQEAGCTQKLQEEIHDWLKSLRPQPRKEIYQAAKHDLAIKFMNYLDENRPEWKMSLSYGECEDIDKAFKENDWTKIMRYIEKYSSHWKPSKEQMEALKKVAYSLVGTGNQNDAYYLVQLYNQLNKQ